ncbi:endogenous retrovirus group K member 25 Pro protein-like [Elephas maximus indicus]|uniref:endogenous retrovirus group K member 25 Pro protein-like n=1 Tax=Elephas maximus indicus TaxID=99487 RepID=UPI002115D7EC|nr:endogenous retrovirus group K member 25 Pro protein-like [Elephas maximus indicus]
MGTVASQVERGDRGFGSSDVVFWLQEITQNRPMKVLLVEGKPINGLMDTGADVSCVAGKDWPVSWPLSQTPTTLVGLGQASQAEKSSQILHWQDESEPQCNGTFQPYVIPPIPFTLWGRDVLSQMGAFLYSPSPQVTVQMTQMHFDPTRGLGKNQQGIKIQASPQNRSPRQGLGYSNL